MLDGIIICERLRLFADYGVNGGEPEFCRFTGGVDKPARDPVSPNYSETYHKRQRTPERGFFVNVARLPLCCALRRTLAFYRREGQPVQRYQPQ